MEINNEEKYGVKISILSAMDLDDYVKIINAIKKIGYKITLADNGNAICEKKKTD